MKLKSLFLSVIPSLALATPTLTATLPPVNPGAIVRQANGLTITCLGDSTCQQGNILNPAGSTYYASSYAVGTFSNSELGWLEAISQHGFVYNPTAFGYPGSYYSLLWVAPLTAGSCTPNTTLTFQPGAPTVSPINTAGSFTLTTSGSGGVAVGQRTNLAAPGSGYTGMPSLTVSGGTCTTQPTFAYALGGVGSFGVPGDVTAGMLFRATQDVCPAQPDIVVIEGGTNDITANYNAGMSYPASYAAITSNLAATVSTLQACGIQRIVLAPITPRNQGTGGWSTAMDKLRIRINRWMQAYALQSRLAANGAAQVVSFDVDHFWTDPTQSGGTIGNPLTAMTFDGLHPSPQGAFTWALAAYNSMKNWASPNIFIPNSQSDIYDATNNPAGNLLGTSGLFLGTSGGNGTPGAGTSTGTVATSWSNSFSGTGTWTVVNSIESARTDGLPGQRQVVTMSATGGGSFDRLTISNFTNYSANLALGTDKIYGQIEVDISNLSNVEYVGCQLMETATVSQQSISLQSGAINPSYPLPTSAQIAKWNEAKSLPDFGLTAAGSFRFPCRTPPITTQVGATGYSFAVMFVVNGSSSATVKLGNAAVRKIAP